MPWNQSFGSNGDMGGGTATAEQFSTGAKKKPIKLFNNGADQFLNDAQDEAFNIRDTENARGAKVEGFLGDEFQRASKPTYDDDTIAKMFSQESDQSARTQLDQEAGLRANLGANGIQGGGYAAGLLTGFEGQRMARITDTRTSMAITRAKQNSEDALNRFKNAGVVAAQMGRDPSTAGSDFLNDLSGIALGKYGIDKQAKAAKSSSKNNLLSGIIQGGVGLLSGLL